MKIEFDDGSIIHISEKQDDWILNIARGQKKWSYIQIETNADEPKNINFIRIGSELAQLRLFGNGFPKSNPRPITRKG